MKVYIVGKKGLFIFLGALAIIFLGIILMPSTKNGQDMEVNTRAKRDLPIYCVETDKPQISISFDAAWADAIYGLCVES